jgi:uncharacterized protein YoaH (UPF0181 family)
MMQGRGVTNFSTSKPSHEYTTSTTEFDDELIRRKIVTKEQSLMAKGASLEEAIRLIEEEKDYNKQKSKKNSKSWTDIKINKQSNNEAINDEDVDVNDSSDDDSFEDDDPDGEAFMQRYRQERIEQLKQHDEKNKIKLALSNHDSSVIHITRNDWKEQVNDASMDGKWVIITMTENSGNLKDHVVQELHQISREYNNNSNNNNNDYSSDDDDDDDDDDEDNCGQRTRSSRLRLLTINADDAIPNWPADNVPAMFAYRDGIKQYEWIATRRGEFPSRAYLEELFQKWNVI